MRKFILYWALYGLIELIMYVWLFQVIGFWPLLFIQAASSAFGVFIFKRLGGNLFRNLRDGRTVAPYLLDSLCFFYRRVFINYSRCYNNYTWTTHFYSIFPQTIKTKINKMAWKSKETYAILLF